MFYKQHFSSQQAILADSNTAGRFDRTLEEVRLCVVQLLIADLAGL
jgi:hypothetical protein